MAESIKELLQSLNTGYLPEIVKGTVVETEPLRVILDNDVKVNLSAASLLIPGRKRALLKPMDKYYFLSLNNRKIYYMLDEV